MSEIRVDKIVASNGSGAVELTGGITLGAGASNLATGLTGTPNITIGTATATSFVKSSGTSGQFLKADGSVDSNTYLTSSSGLNATCLTSGTVNVNRLGSSGTRDSTTFLRGDNTWSTISGGAINVCNTYNFLSCNTCAPSINSGTYNLSVGCNAGLCLTSGSYNNFLGFRAGCKTSTGRYNNFFGGRVAQCNTSGCFNNFFGCGAGCSNIAGSNNNFFGRGAGYSNQYGSQNVYLGYNAGCSINNGACNIVIGSFTGAGFTACSNHIFLSDGAGNNRLQLNNCGALGFGSANYGNAGQVLTSCGPAAAPVWAAASGPINVCNTSNFLSCNTCAPSISGATHNFFVGLNAGRCITSGGNNVMLGRYAGGNTNTGRYNFFGGYSAGSSNTAGRYNVFLGNGAGLGNTTGCRNIAIGSYAGRNNTIGSKNAFFGFYAGCNITGGCNVVIGGFYGTGFTNCNNHIFLSDGAGNNRLQINCTGALGFGSANYGNAGQVLTSCGPAAAPVWAAASGPINVYNTSNFLSCNVCAANITTNATNNIFIGHRAGRCIISGRNNIGLGRYAGGRVDTGRYNFFGGYSAGSSTTSGRYNVFLGQGAALGNTTGCHNIAIGSYAGRNNTIGSKNAFFGFYAGCNITGGCNVVIGGFYGTGFTACSNHIFLSDGAGNNRLQINNSGALGFGGASYGTAGQVLTSCGSGAAPVWAAASGGGGSGAIAGCCTSNFLSCNTCAPSISGGQGNFFVGCNAGRCITSGGNNFLVGCFAGNRITSGFHNNFFGLNAGYSTTTGSKNTIIGCDSGYYNTIGSCNIFIGGEAGFYNSIGSFNVFIGHQAAGCYGAGNSTGCNNIAIGCQSGIDGLYNFASTGGNNIIVMGNNSHTAAYVKVAWTTGSDARDKTNIIPIPVGRDFLKQLNPVQYQWADRETSEVTVEKPNYGFLAQDILALEDAPTIIVDDHDPEHLKVRETMIIPVLVKTVQELIEEVDALKEEVRILKGE